MGGETDFHKLYVELGLAPGCDMRALTHAYRRRIQELHPDRRQRVDDPAADERLRTLIALYDAACAFHRRYGRLPGAAFGATPAPRPVVPDRPMPEPRPRSRNWTAALALPAIAALLWWYWDAAVPEPLPVPELASGDDVAPRDAQQLALGMDPDNVRAIQGQPPLDLGDRWEYGPSYVRFEHRKLVDWYSSPLRPLHASSQRPPPPAPPPPTLH